MKNKVMREVRYDPRNQRRPVHSTTSGTTSADNMPNRARIPEKVQPAFNVVPVSVTFLFNNSLEFSRYFWK